eukprot:Gb_21808 [translate_table: standard]
MDSYSSETTTMRDLEKAMHKTFVKDKALVEKDWLAFGHPFADRLGMPTFSGYVNTAAESFNQLSGSSNASPIRVSPGSSFTPSVNAHSSATISSNYSPIFLQWVDCVAQLLRMYPRAFEFSSAYLVDFVDCVISCRFGNFLCNRKASYVKKGLDRMKIGDTYDAIEDKHCHLKP